MMSFEFVKKSLNFGLKNAASWAACDGEPTTSYASLSRALEVVGEIERLGWDAPSDTYPLPDGEICIEWQYNTKGRKIIRLTFYGDDRDLVDGRSNGMLMLTFDSRSPYFISVDLNDLTGVWPLPEFEHNVDGISVAQ